MALPLRIGDRVRVYLVECRGHVLATVMEMDDQDHFRWEGVYHGDPISGVDHVSAEGEDWNRVGVLRSS